MKLTTAKYYIPSRRCIQSVEYDNGEPVDIPDDRRSKFKTRNGRTVLDGGGVSPDVALPAPEKSELLDALQTQHMIMKYVSDYCKDIDTIESAGTYTFSDYQDFVQYLDKQDFTYETSAEKDLTELKNHTSAAVAEQIANLEDAIRNEKRAALQDEKAGIINSIEQEIVGRYQHQSGKAHQALNDDAEVLAAIALLNDPSRYASILK